MPEGNAAAASLVLPCLSILQPWAHFIVKGPKDVENRSWNSKRRGLFLIHAGKAFRRDEFDAACGLARNCGVERKSLPRFDRADLPVGGIVGAAVLQDVLAPGRGVSG